MEFAFWTFFTSDTTQNEADFSPAKHQSVTFHMRSCMKLVGYK